MTRTYGLHLAASVWLMLAISGSPLSPSLIFTALAQETAAADASAAADNTPEPLTDEELEVLVARIALYPDELVALVTSASLYPLQIVEAARYLDQVKKDAKLKPKDTWDGSIVSLLNYPQIVKMMSDDLDWTQSLGEALSHQQKDVLVAIQQLRDKAVADGIIKTDDKMKVTEENDNVVIQSASSETIYIPQYPPEMLYEPNYVPAPVTYYDESYPNYSYPSAPYFAALVTGAIWAGAIDWDDWGVWGGRWDGDVDIDCDRCFNDIDLDGKFNINDMDWKNVDRSKIKFDKNQFNNIDRNSLKNSIKANDRNSIKAKANTIGNDRASNVRSKAGNVSVKDVRNSKIEADRINRDKANAARNRPGGDKIAAAGKKPSQVAQNRKSTAKVNKPKANAKRPVKKPKPAARVDNRPKKPSALGRVDNGRRTQMQSNRGRQSMGGGHRGGGHRSVHRGGGGGRRR